MSGGSSRRSLRVGNRSVRRAHRSASSALPTELMERLAALETSVAALGEALERLDKQMSRVGREQFKVNTLIEAQQKNTETQLEQLRDTATYRERELTQLRERLTEATTEGRMEVIRRLFPALDGLEEALASGRRQLQRLTARTDPSFWQRLNPARRAALVAESSVSQATAAWLEGLAFVQERLGEALAAVDVVPILTEGQAFDPHWHIAVETVPATDRIKPGTILREHRRGYIQGETVLRYAEVVVARAPLENSL